MLPTRLPLRSLAAATLTALACSSGGGNGGPMTPDPPAVTGIAPAQARVGESVTISGSGFGTSAAAVSVTFRGTAAQVTAVTATEITATVPEIAPGSAPVAVSVGGTAAGQTAFTVAQTPPVITSIEPASVRAGEEITIRGEGFLEPVAGSLVPADVAYVQLDMGQLEQLPISSRNFSELVAMVPGTVPPGTHDIVVEVGGLTAQLDDVDFHVGTIRGSFAGFGEITSNTFNGLQVGLRLDYDFTLDEDAFDRNAGTGTLTGKLNGLYPVTGTFDRFGAFELGGPIAQDKSYLFTGTLGRDDQGRQIVQDGLLRATQGGNELRFEYSDAVNWIDELVDTSQLTVSYGDIVTGNGPVPAATYQYVTYDPLSWEPAIQLAGELGGNWFMSTNPLPHIGTFTGTMRLFYGDIQIGTVPVAPIRTFVTPLNSSDEVALIGLDAAGLEVLRTRFEQVDNQANPFNRLRYSLDNEWPDAYQDVDLEPEGNGFTALIQAGAFLMPEDLAPMRAAQRLDFGFGHGEVPTAE